MAGLDNDLNVGELARRLGAKGPAASWPVVPGLFPTVQIDDVAGLVGSARKTIGCAGAATIILGGGNTAEYEFFAETDCIVNLIHLSALETEWWGIFRGVKGSAHWPGVGGTPASVALGENPVSCVAQVVAPRISQGMFLCRHSEAVIPLRAELKKADVLVVTAQNVTLNTSSTGVCFYFEELPVARIEP